ncbi:hypothetical protein JAAARDRAFT_327377 [Jaapia argillacea MUCL 33604]|uniref:Uncharacterized protein n=1 Tax=Jaapia argillacea MUCL 33604 TaxID=933084 RepID=A0A067PPH4_9AGAM|nr:hypothetical protein JAAARDRAFT_327377 [Jaapia argillacea MUCL 33604]
MGFSNGVRKPTSWIFSLALSFDRRWILCCSPTVRSQSPPSSILPPLPSPFCCPIRGDILQPCYEACATCIVGSECVFFIHPRLHLFLSLPNRRFSFLHLHLPHPPSLIQSGAFLPRTVYCTRPPTSSVLIYTFIE